MLVAYLFADLNKSTKEGADFGNNCRKAEPFSEDTIKTNDILSQQEPIKLPSYQNSDIESTINANKKNTFDGLEGDKIIESMITTGDQITNNPEKPLSIKVKSHTEQDQIIECQEVDQNDLNQFSFERVLKIDTLFQERILKRLCVRKRKVCTSFAGNHGYDDPNCTTFRWIQNFERCVIDYHSSCSSLGWRYYDSSAIEERPERFEIIKEYWQSSNPKLMEAVKKNQCNIVHAQCLDANTSKPYPGGRQLQRPCWKDRVTVVCPGALKDNPCATLRKKGCELIEENGQKKKYRCSTHVLETIDGGYNKIHCIDGGSLTATSAEHSDMSSSLAQLAAVNAMQKECQDNMDNPKIFKGEIKKCTKNILGDLLYDCCGSLKGFALTLNLTACNAEEKQLSILREHDRCYYVGSYANETIVWKSSDTHVYCCYPSKLIAILQKEARKQLGKNFGTPYRPDCEGLSIEEISRLDFSKMDLSPIFDDIIKNVKNKKPNVDVKNIENIMHKKIETMNSKALETQSDTYLPGV